MYRTARNNIVLESDGDVTSVSKDPAVDSPFPDVNTDPTMAAATVLPSDDNAEANPTLTPVLLVQILREWIHRQTRFLLGLGC